MPPPSTRGKSAEALRSRVSASAVIFPGTATHWNPSEETISRRGAATTISGRSKGETAASSDTRTPWLKGVGQGTDGAG